MEQRKKLLNYIQSELINAPNRAMMGQAYDKH